MDSTDIINDLEQRVRSLRTVIDMMRDDSDRKDETIYDLRAEINALWDAPRYDLEHEHETAEDLEEGLAAAVHDQAAALNRFAQAAYEAGTEPAYHSFDVVSIATALVAARVNGEIAGGLAE